MKTFPCPYCARLGEESITQGDTVDMGSDESGCIMVQIGPDWPCGGCDGKGFIEVGSERHFDIKCNSVMVFICKTFETREDIEVFELCEQAIDFKPIKKVWLKLNKQ